MIIEETKVVVIVVTFNGEGWVDRCFGSLRSSGFPVSTIAVDNASADGTVSAIKEKYPDVEIIETGANLGFGKANNIGFKKALQGNADYVFLINQDVWIETDTIQKLIDAAETNKDFGVISPFHLLPGQNKLEWHFSTYIAPEKCPDLYSDIYFRSTKEIYQLEFVNAAAWLIDKRTLLEVGGFDPLFPHYGEDDDYCNRLVYKKIKMGVVPSAIITHDISLKTWEEIKFNFQRQLVFCFIELKNIRFSYKYVLYNYTKNRIGKIFNLLVLRKWKELKLMTKIFLVSLTYVGTIYRSREISKKAQSYLN